MEEEITPKVFEHLVDLAALELTEKEKEYIRKELNNQLNAVHELQSIPLDNKIKPASHGIIYTPAIRSPIRDDILKPFDEPDKILAQAPKTESRYIVVPDIPHTDLE